MQSVYPTRELPHLLRLPSTARRAQLLEVCRISAGVRIFNWDCRGRKADTDSTHGLLDLPGLVKEAAAVTRKMVTASVEDIESRLWAATAALEATQLQTAGAGEGASRDPRVDPDLLKETVIFLRQQQVLFRRLLEDVEGAGEEARRLTAQLEAGLGDVHAVVQSKTAVPTNQVYPQFMSLASTWEALEAQAVVISRAASIHRRLGAYSKDVHCVDDTVLRGFLDKAQRPTPTDAERVSSGLTAGADADLRLLEAARKRLDRDLGRGDVVAEVDPARPGRGAPSARPSGPPRPGRRAPARARRGPAGFGGDQRRPPRQLQAGRRTRRRPPARARRHADGGPSETAFRRRGRARPHADSRAGLATEASDADRGHADRGQLVPQRDSRADLPGQGRGRAVPQDRGLHRGARGGGGDGCAQHHPRLNTDVNAVNVVLFYSPFIVYVIMLF
ncbi:cilia- and flagella-associated protein 206-like isoform X2 [Frankliniella occidentalis]|uniref:Cilia- and flagella-associated protein 206 n=1 Tax=Frankliniella occidentalis TaxID=133901 RepID=A0A9C6XV27_FRAOC|nr:cilia- and flagella-associated protein 206-like isoform X2 [Frankliniella occidentalis]